MANLLFAPENLTRSGLKTPEGVSLHAGWYNKPKRHKGRPTASGLWSWLALSAHHKVGEPDHHPECLEEGDPDHEARHKLHGKPERHQNEAAKRKRFGS